MAWLKLADSLGGLNHRLVKNVVCGHEMLQIAGEPPGNMMLKTVVVEQKHLRHGRPIPFDRLMKKFGFEMSDRHGNHPD